MSQPIATLCGRIPVALWDLVLHIGAGSQPSTLLLPSVRRLVLVEGDAGTRLQLALSTAGRPGVEVWSDVVVPRAGVAAWQRYSLPPLNGPREQVGLEAVYPRLQHLGTAVAQGTAIEELLTRALAGEGGDAYAPADRLLVLDVPGQEGELLSALTPEVLARFEWVLLRKLSLADQAASVAAEDRLAAAGFRQSLHEAKDEPLWPLSLFRLHGASLLARQMAVVTAQLQQIERTGAQAAQSLQLQLKDAQQSAEALRVDRDQERQWHVDNARWAKSLQSDLATRDAERDELRHQLHSLQEQIQALGKHNQDRLEQAELGRAGAEAALASAREAEQAALSEVDALRSSIDELRQGADRARQLQDQGLLEAQTLSEQVGRQLFAAQEECAALRDALQAASAAGVELQRDRDQERQWHLDNATWAKKLQRDLSASEAERDELRQELQSAQQQAQDAESNEQGLRQQVAAATAAADAARAEARSAESAAQAQAETQRTEVKALQGALEDHRLHAERLEQELSKAGQQEADLQVRCDHLQAELHAASAATLELQRDRDQEHQWHLDNAAWAQALKRDLAASQAEQARLQQALQAVETEAQAAAESAKEQVDALQADAVALQERLSSQGVEHVAVIAERDQERHWHRENAQWAQSLKADNDKLAKESETLRRQITDGEGRSRLLDQEILRAEAQLDLIKDVLLREKNF